MRKAEDSNPGPLHYERWAPVAVSHVRRAPDVGRRPWREAQERVPLDRLVGELRDRLGVDV